MNHDLIGIWLRTARDYAVILLDPEGVVTHWLGAAEQVLGYPAAQAVGRSISLLFTPEDRARHLDRLELDIARVDSRSEDERWHLRGDGSRIWTSGTVTALHDEDKHLLGFIKVLRDRTDMRIRTERLEAEVAELQAGRERTHEFLRTLGHELRNPLAPLGNTKFIIERLATDDRMKAAARTIGTQVELLRRLADDLMDITRLEQGQLKLELQQLDLRKLLETEVAGLAEATAHKRLELQVLVPQVPVVVEADPARFGQVVLNLLGNAVKYTPSGGVVWVKLTQEAHEAVLRVEDTGIGIAPEVLPRIFDLFTRESRASELAPGGLGVGLALVRQLVELHGGSVQARSAGLGKGAEFTVRLALAPPAQEGGRPGPDVIHSAI
ncbi:PAS domain-containing sensor histidine kinase [Ramlibacter tataouinensis]|uniref:histidine kinase n=1 Tax=Ramlibacter tataouinensis (strain ATCC BAA-407 / DSM 14655 / LMG 21543 / TTB310) TaxID=365046 RepID=F5XYK7_RAMTT|nr:PAS domain-containing sensor histidine kinase [Ramlibacter tataouinensis]AEG93183.1 candidate histidine kinase, classic [Ramlibacter tataouinensis TTB310]